MGKSKMTVLAVLTAINDIRKLTPGLIEADNKLLDLQERLLNDYGNDPQTKTFVEAKGDPAWPRV